MAGYKMDRYHHGFSTVVPSGLRSAHMRAQLKVENPVPLRTIWNFDLLPAPRASFCCRATLTYPKALIKNRLKIKARRYGPQWRHEHCTQKERWREGVSSTRTVAARGSGYGNGNTRKVRKSGRSAPRA